MKHLISADPEIALDCIVIAIAQCNDPQALGAISAGPREDLIAEQGSLVIGRIEELAQRQPRFRYNLTGVWPLGQDEEGEVWQRVLRARASGPEINCTDRVRNWDMG